MFRAGAKLVEFTVVVLDKKGNPVTDLRKEDFTVLDNGKSREIAFFRYEGAPAAAPAAVAPGPSGFFTNRSASGTPRNVTALVLDTLNTSVQDQMIVKAQAAQFLDRLAPDTRVALYELGTEFRVLHDLTSDMESLREELRRMKVSMQLSRTSDVGRLTREAEATIEMLRGMRNQYGQAYVDQIERMLKTQIAGELNANSKLRDAQLQQTLATLETLGRHMTVIPGRKSMIWISGGVSMTSVTVSTDPRRASRINPASGRDYQEAIRDVARHLAQAGVSLYSVDAHGLTSGAEGFSEEQYMRPMSSDLSSLARTDTAASDPRAAFATLTSVTGGRPFHHLNDFSEAIRRAANDQRGSYSLGFYATDSDGKWHPLKATVKRSGAEILYRQGYQADSAETRAESADDILRRALLDPALATGMRLNARYDPLARQIELRIELAGIQLKDGQGEVTLLIGEKTVDGKIRFQQSALRLNLKPEQIAALQKDGVPYRAPFRPEMDTMTVRIVTRDTATGMLGSVDVPVPR